MLLPASSPWAEWLRHLDIGSCLFQGPNLLFSHNIPAAMKNSSGHALRLILTMSCKFTLPPFKYYTEQMDAPDIALSLSPPPPPPHLFAGVRDVKSAVLTLFSAR